MASPSKRGKRGGSRKGRGKKGSSKKQARGGSGGQIAAKSRGKKQRSLLMEDKEDEESDGDHGRKTGRKNYRKKGKTENLVIKAAAKRGLAELKKNGGKMPHGWYQCKVARLKEGPFARCCRSWQPRSNTEFKKVKKEEEK